MRARLKKHREAALLAVSGRDAAPDGFAMVTQQDAL
jgi:hypothetical protein